MPTRKLKIISGGQTGVDRAALDAALDHGVPCGGWVPAGRKAEDGPIDSRYPLEETKSKNYAVRTKRNVRESDGTVIICRGEPTGGTVLTRHVAERAGRPLLVIDANATTPDTAVASICTFVALHEIESLNIAGPRASQQPHIYEFAYAAIAASLQACGYDEGSNQTE